MTAQTAHWLECTTMCNVLVQCTYTTTIYVITCIALNFVCIAVVGRGQDDLLGMRRDSLRLIKVHRDEVEFAALQNEVQGNANQ